MRVRARRAPASTETQCSAKPSPHRQPFLPEEVAVFTRTLPPEKKGGGGMSNERWLVDLYDQVSVEYDIKFLRRTSNRA